MANMALMLKAEAASRPETATECKVKPVRGNMTAKPTTSKGDVKELVTKETKVVTEPLH